MSPKKRLIIGQKSAALSLKKASGRLGFYPAMQEVRERLGARTACDAARASMSLWSTKKGIDAVGLCEAGETSRQIDDLERGATCLSGTLPREEDGQRGRVELRKRCAVHAIRARRDALQTRRERGIRARVGQRRTGFEAAGDGTGFDVHRGVHDCLPAASC